MGKLKKVSTELGENVEEVIVDVGVKAGVSSAIVKWGIGIALTLISAAFGYGGYLATKANANADMKQTLAANTEAISKLDKKVSDGFDGLNDRIDKIYTDGYKEFTDFQEYNKEQLKLIIDYSGTQKDLLKKMLDVNTMSKNKDIQNKIEEAKNDKSYGIVVRQVKPTEYVNIFSVVSNDSKDTTYSVIGATKAFLNKIEEKFGVKNISTNKNNASRYDFIYYKK